MKTVINADMAPRAIGPYSQAVKINGFLFISGQIPLEPISGQIVYGGAESQTYQVLNNIRTILEHEKLNFSDVIKTTIFLTNMDDFDIVNRVYAKFFPDKQPARSCVQVAALPRNVSVEIETIAAY